MKRLLFLLLLLSGIVHSQITVIHFNATWNSSNDVKWFGDLTDCKLKNIDIWLKFFEPNHQSMLISKKLAQKYDFGF